MNTLNRIYRVLEIALETGDWRFVEQAKAMVDCFDHSQKPFHKQVTLKEALEQPCSD